MGKDRKKINGKRLIGGNENEANKPDMKNKLYLNKLELFSFRIFILLIT